MEVCSSVGKATVQRGIVGKKGEDEGDLGTLLRRPGHVPGGRLLLLQVQVFSFTVPTYWINFQYRRSLNFCFDVNCFFLQV